jgi:guanylate kinase
MRAQLGLALTGLTGAGKSTLQRLLLERGCWSPHLYTSRTVEQHERDATSHVDRDDLVGGVQRGNYVAAMIFADEVYTWSAADFQRLRVDSAGVVLNARPYTALLLAVAVPRLVPVWLDLDEDERFSRLQDRGESRDTDPVRLLRRKNQDAEDLAYRALFAVRVVSDDSALDKLIHLVEHGPNA